MIKKYFEISFFIFFTLLIISSCTVHYKSVSDAESGENQKSNNFQNGEFINANPTEGMTESFLTVAYKYMFENNNKRKPSFEIPTVKVDIDSFANKSLDNLSVIWLGHATTLINIDGTIILTDPILTKWASPVDWFGPKRFFNSPIDIEELPILDAVVISHNHYDHLDRESVLSINGKTKIFIVPIGVGAILERWGILTEKIVEKKWWEIYQLNETVKIITTPTHHFSGRSILDRNKTLWASYIIKSKNHSVYFGGDSGFFKGYKEIGEKYGPFEITVLPIGAYSEMWKSIHMDAEEAVQAHLDLKGNLLFPIHWGTFNLALHGWIEPAEHLITASAKENVKIAIPKPGEVVKKNSKNRIEKWWVPSRERGIVEQKDNEKKKNYDPVF